MCRDRLKRWQIGLAMLGKISLRNFVDRRSAPKLLFGLRDLATSKRSFSVIDLKIKFSTVVAPRYFSKFEPESGIFLQEIHPC